MMKKQCDERTLLTLLDVLGSCITDVFYNHLYDRAIAIHEKTKVSVTDAYRRTVSEYIAESDSPRFYTLLLNSLHHYVRMSTIYNDISYPDCITLYTGMFVPQMYMASLTSDQKVDILSMTLKHSVVSFAEDIINDHLSGIIDDHSDPINVEVLQDVILKILLRERDTSYQKFVQSQKPSEPKPVKPVKATSKVQPQALAKLTTVFKKSVNERAALKKQNALLSKKNKMLASQFQELKSMFLTQIGVQKDQAKVIETLKKQLDRASSIEDESIQDESIQEKVNEQVDNGEFDDSELFSVQYLEN